MALETGVTLMMTVGETLRRERLKRNLELDQVSRELKISVRFLEAIEDEEFEKLPGGVFAKAFVRQYGRLLGLNDDELTAQLQQTLEPPQMEPEPHRPARTGLPPIQVPRMEEWQTVGDRGFHWSGSLSAAIVVVLVMLVCSGVYTWLQRPHTPVSARTPATAAAQLPAAPLTQPSTVAQSTPVPPPGEQAPNPTSPPATPETQATAAVPSPPETSAAPQPVAAAATKPEASPAPNPAATVHVVVTADEAVWVLARVDGKFAFTGTMEPQQTRSLDGVENVVLRLGNAGGVSITLNGKPVGPVGPKGQIRTIQFTSGGFQIVPAPKPPSDGAPPVARL